MYSILGVAYAMAPSAGGEGGEQNPIMMFMPLILMFVIFYFLLIRPQQKKAKQHRELLGALKKGDWVLTNGGIIGKVVDMDGDVLDIELNPSNVIKVSRGYVAGTTEPPVRSDRRRKKEDEVAEDAVEAGE